MFGNKKRKGEWKNQILLKSKIEKERPKKRLAWVVKVNDCSDSVKKGRFDPYHHYLEDGMFRQDKDGPKRVFASTEDAVESFKYALYRLKQDEKPDPCLGCIEEGGVHIYPIDLDSYDDD